MDRLDRIEALVRHSFGDLRIVDRATSPALRAAEVLLRPVVSDLGTRFTTVIGSTVYTPGPPERLARDALAATLAHEYVHMLDQRRYGVAFYVSYALPPCGRTMRAYWERRGYAVDLMLAWEAGGAPAIERRLRSIRALFAGSAYGWMWAGEDAARRYLEPVAADVAAGRLQVTAPYAAILAAWRGPGGPPAGGLPSRR